MKRLSYNDSCFAKIDGGAFDLVLPSGKHVRGEMADEIAAVDAVASARMVWILQQWERGELSGGQNCGGQYYRVPLT